MRLISRGIASAWMCSGVLGLAAVGCGSEEPSALARDKGPVQGAPNDGGGERGDAGPQADAHVADADAAESVTECPPQTPGPLTRVRFLPAAGNARAMVGGTIQGSNLSPTNGFVVLATIASAPAEGEFAELAIANTERYRYVKYYSPDGSYGSVAELEFYAGDQRLTGAAFGSSGSRAESGSSYEQALDGDPTTAFQGAIPSGNYVGLDVGQGALAAAPSFTPPAGHYADVPLRVSLGATSEGVRIRYTLDGSNPSRDHGDEWTGEPITLPEGATQLKALAFHDCLFDSEVVGQLYSVGGAAPIGRGQKSYHIGNSLTDTINPWLEPIADSTGVDHVYARWTIPGAPPHWLWEHQGEGFEDPSGAASFSSFVRSFAPIDHISVQPFSDNTLTTHGGDARAMFREARSFSPEVQFWIYSQWPSLTSWDVDGLARGAEQGAPPSAFPPAPKSWEEATLNQQRFNERFRAYVDAGVEGKPVLVVPAGAALVSLKRAIEAGQVPGIGDFEGQHFDDDLHLSKKGQYLVALVFYACIYRQSPEGRVTFADTGLSEEQARVYQRVAWDTVKAYPWAGVAPLPE